MHQLRFLPRDVFLVDTIPKTVDEILSKKKADKKTITKGLVTLVIGVIPEAAEITRPGRLEYSLNGRGFTYIDLANEKHQYPTPGWRTFLFTNLVRGYCCAGGV